jgi:MoaA/NifB/PqqE/SkfB family radical SAM enzyme
MLVTSAAGTGLARGRLRLEVLKRTFQRQSGLLAAPRLLNQLAEKRRTIHGLTRVRKFARAKGRYFITPDSPGWPSQAFGGFIDNELGRLGAGGNKAHALQTVIFAITSRCPLQCRHCFEWDNLDAGEHLSAGDLDAVMRKLQQHGVRHVQLSGGEPLARFGDLVDLTGKYGREMDLWVLTSGFGLTSEKAAALSMAGLTGANISLDHWDPAGHNDFRNHADAFRWAGEAAANCRRAGMAVSLSLCAARSFVTAGNLGRYRELAREWGADFIRVLEPRQAGRFSGPETELSRSQTDLLDSFYLETNLDPKFRQYPIISYPGYHQRRVGCFGAGNRYLYIDSKGDFHACPFCLGSVGNALTGSLVEAIEKMKSRGCHVFRVNKG